MIAPKWLTIAGSLMYGITVHTMTKIPESHVICETNIDNFDREDGVIKTPHGSLFHHSTDPRLVNCEIIIVNDTRVQVRADREIKPGEELLINYDYNPYRYYDYFSIQ